LVGLVKENLLIQVHEVSNFINVCHPRKTPKGIPLHIKQLNWKFG